MYYTIHDDYTVCKKSPNKMFRVKTSTEHVKVRDLPPTGLRLTPALKAYFVREASINGRSLHAELVRRLEESKRRDEGAVTTHSGHLVVEPSAAVPALSEGERAVISLFKRLTPEKQLALLSLLK